MKDFEKPPITVSEQLELLKQRGLTILDKERASRFLEVVTLFRLSPYMRPFQNSSDINHSFVPGTTLRQIVTVYNFDRELRNLIMDAAERFEVAVRTSINNHMTNSTQDAHWYLSRDSFNTRYDHDRLIREQQKKLNNEKLSYQRDVKYIDKSTVTDSIKQQRKDQRKRDNYFRYYGQTYYEPSLPPSWAMLEELSVGSLSHLYAGIARDKDRKEIARRFNLPQEVLKSWLHTLTFIRNCCAHHARLWNRELSVPPRLPRHTQWQFSNNDSGAPNPGRRMYIVLLMLVYLMQQVSPDSRWAIRLLDLFSRYPSIPLRNMGFPSDWLSHPLWQRALLPNKDPQSDHS